MPSKEGPMKLPSISSPAKKTGKKTLFDDEEQIQVKPVEKKVEKKPAAKRGTLFDD